MNRKQTYLVTAYKISDTDTVVSYIYKLTKLGSENPKWLWICINDEGGFGTALEFNMWANTEVESYKRMLNVADLTSPFEIIDGTLHDAIAIQDAFIKHLNNER